jgi:hypothetical protein
MKKIEFSIAEFEKRGGIPKCRLVTRGGESARVICTDAPSVYPVIGIINESFYQWTSDGLLRSNVVGTGDLLILDETPVRYIAWTREQLAILLKNGPLVVVSKDDPNDVRVITRSRGNTQSLLQGFTQADGSPCGVVG